MPGSIGFHFAFIFMIQRNLFLAQLLSVLTDITNKDGNITYLVATIIS